MLKRLIVLFASAFVLAAALTACGGGGSKDNPGGGASTDYLKGIAAYGAALANATVSVKDSKGVILTGTTDSNGKFSIGADGLAVPFVVRVQGGGKVYVSYSESIDNVNVTPFTTQVMSFAYGQDLSALTSINELTLPDTAQLAKKDTMADNYIKILGAVCSSDAVLTNMLLTFDLFTSNFIASGTGFDMMLDLVKIEPDYTGNTLKVGVRQYDGSGMLQEPAPADILQVNVDADTALDSASTDNIKTNLADDMSAAAEIQKGKYMKKVIFVVDSYNSSDADNGLYLMRSDGSEFDGSVFKKIPSITMESKSEPVLMDGDWFVMISDVLNTDHTQVIGSTATKYNIDGTKGDEIDILQDCFEITQFSHDGTKIAGLWEDGLYFVDGATKSKYSVPFGDMDLFGASWGPDNATLYAGGVSCEDKAPKGGDESGCTYDLYKLTKNSIVNITNTPNEIKGYPAVSFDGFKIAYLVLDSTTHETALYAGNLGTSSITGIKKIVDFDDYDVDFPVWTPEGKILFIKSEIAENTPGDASSGETQSTSAPKGYLYSVDPDGGNCNLMSNSIPEYVRSISIQP